MTEIGQFQAARPAHRPLTRLFRQLHHANPEHAALAEIAELEVLSQSWREKALSRLNSVPKPQS